MVVFVFERASWFQLAHSDTPSLDDLLRRGAVGLMNPPREANWQPLPGPDSAVEIVRDGAGERETAIEGWPPPRVLAPDAEGELRRSDRLLGEIEAQLDSRRDLLIVCAVPGQIERAAVDPAWAAMSLIVIAGPGFGPALLTSASTRRPGVAANTDIGPTVLRFLGRDVPEAVTGHPLRSIPALDAAQTIARLDWATSVKVRLRPRLVFYHSMWVLLALIAGAVGLALGVRERTRAGRLIGAMLLLALALPIGLLLQPVAPVEHAIAAGIIAFGWAACAAWAVGRIPTRPMRVGVLCATIAALLLAATLIRSSLLWRSALGYDLTTGSRFHGIGNEWMAILVASAAIACGTASDLWRRARRWQLLFWLALTIVIGAPSLGANWGGCLTASAVGIVLALLLARPARWWHAAAGFGGAAAAVGAVLAANLAARDQTHIARSVHLVARHGLGVAADLARHRLAATLVPLDYTPLVIVPALFMAAALVALALPAGPWRRTLGAHPGLRAGLLAAVAGGFAAAVLNDSGVVALAAACAVALPSVVYVGFAPVGADSQSARLVRSTARS